MVSMSGGSPGIRGGFSRALSSAVAARLWPGSKRRVKAPAFNSSCTAARLPGPLEASKKRKPTPQEAAVTKRRVAPLRTGISPIKLMRPTVVEPRLSQEPESTSLAADETSQTERCLYCVYIVVWVWGGEPGASCFLPSELPAE